MAESTRSRLTRYDEFWEVKPANCQSCDNNLEGVSVWCDRDKLSRFIDNVREGDRLELINSNPPRLHSWAICKMNHFDWSTVQFCNRANEDGGVNSTRNTFLNVDFPASKNVFVVTPIFMFLNWPGSKVRINNLKDKDWSPLGTGHIIKEVTYQLRELHESDAFCKAVYVCRNQFKDSKEFVNYCRYDRDQQHNYCIYNNYGILSKWYSKANHEGFIHEVRVGDRLEFRCNSTYERWGIYIGQWGDDLEQVVLFAHGDKTNSATSTERLKPNPCVKSIRIHVFDGCNQVRINNDDDWEWPPLDRESILNEISHQLSGRAGTSHKVLFSDSEGFVNHCRYDWCINFGLVSAWGSLHDHRMRVGDRLEFHRPILPYAHWGIYVGRWGTDYNQVVHFAPADGNGKLFSKKKSSGSGSSAKDKPVLCVDHIEDVVGIAKVRINNERDHFWPPLVRTDILDEIKRQLKSQSHGHKPVYNLFSNNCEHFVNHCRYEKHHSDQVSPFSRNGDRKGQASSKIRDLWTIGL